MLSNQLSEGIREWTVDIICPVQSLIKLGERLWKWEIWGSHDYADEDSRLLGYEALSILWSYRFFGGDCCRHI